VLPGWQVPLLAQHPLGQVVDEQVGWPWHWPDCALHFWPGRQLPQVPVLPQPSGPHSRFLQLGAQHNPSWPPVVLHWLAGGSQQPCPAQHPVAVAEQVCDEPFTRQVGGWAAQRWLKQLFEQHWLFC
jgi:hypothetical protein